MNEELSKINFPLLSKQYIAYAKKMVFASPHVLKFERSQCTKLMASQ